MMKPFGHDVGDCKKNIYFRVFFYKVFRNESILVHAYIFKQAPPCLGISLSKLRY
ncbi:uncharacterized protein METZ01_LOCUS400860, partial [marine metagenome]